MNIKEPIKSCRKGFTLIELLIVVAIIGILAAVGAAVIPGLLEKAKITATKANYNLFKKQIVLQIQMCEINGYVELMLKNKDSTIYKENCTGSKWQTTGGQINPYIFSYSVANHLNNSGEFKNPYKSIYNDGNAFWYSHPNNSKMDVNLGFVLFHGENPNKITLHSCFKKPCNNSSNRLVQELYYNF
tara:strand:+ start:168 stop:728 length:561 start_codon:yes stop_codon:yes gene_type:complete